MKKVLATFLSVTVLMAMGCAKESKFFSKNAQPVPQLGTTSQFTYFNVVYPTGVSKLSTRQKSRIRGLLAPHDKSKYLVLSPCRDYRRDHIKVNKKRFVELFDYLKKDLHYKVSAKKAMINACTNPNMIQISTFSNKVVLPKCMNEKGKYIMGCALERNLGVMLADPNDLTPSKAPQEFDSVPMVKAVENYRAGKGDRAFDNVQARDISVLNNLSSGRGGGQF